MEGGGDVSGQLMDFDKELAQLLFGDGGIGPSSDLANTIQDIHNENSANQQQEQQQELASNSSHVIGVNSVIPPAPMDPVPFDMSPEAIVDSLPDLMGFDVNLLGNSNNSNSSSGDDLDSQLAQLAQDPFLFEQSQQLLQEVSSLINISDDQGIALSEPSNPGSVQEVLSPASVSSSASTVIIDSGGLPGRVRNSSSRSSDEGISGMGVHSNSNSGAELDVITDVEQILEEKPNVEGEFAQNLYGASDYFVL